MELEVHIREKLTVVGKLPISGGNHEAEKQLYDWCIIPTEDILERMRRERDYDYETWARKMYEEERKKMKESRQKPITITPDEIRFTSHLFGD